MTDSDDRDSELSAKMRKLNSDKSMAKGKETSHKSKSTPAKSYDYDVDGKSYSVTGDKGSKASRDKAISAARKNRTSR